MKETKPFTLCELNTQVKCGIKNIFPDSYWVIAEISEVNINQSGHCYMELIEKSCDTEQIIAKAKATIWAFTFRMLKPYFESVTGQKLSVGLKVLLMVSVEFNELYGYSLNVKDIEPNFTLGDLTRKKQEIIKQLQNEGVFDLNKQLNFPIVPQRIAIISSETAAGYGDFIDQLNNNTNGYKYYFKLFQAYMQGGDAEQSIIQALEEIFSTGDFFDLAVIIRGGGSQSDLDCFNSYWLCYHITQFPIPVLTGIGHERDETIADLVAYERLKTPTAVAEFIIGKTEEFEEQINELSLQALSLIKDKVDELFERIEDKKQRIKTYAKLYLKNESHKIHQWNVLFQKEFKNSVKNAFNEIETISNHIKTASLKNITREKKLLDETNKNVCKNLKNNIMFEKNKLKKYSEKLHILDPANILKRGYTITYCNNQIIKDAKVLQNGNVITTKWHNGTAESRISEVY